jgi:hypothetical protein
VLSEESEPLQKTLPDKIEFTKKSTSKAAGKLWEKIERLSKTKELATNRPTITKANWNTTSHQSGFSPISSVPQIPISIKSSSEKSSAYPEPVRPTGTRKGWPLAAVIDWETWGKRSPQRFFTLWPELSM